jgi:hypothetical protein
MSGVIPEIWKIAVVKPIKNVKNAINPEDFRPINKMPVFEIILEIIVKDKFC